MLWGVAKSAKLPGKGVAMEKIGWNPGGGVAKKKRDVRVAR